MANIMGRRMFHATRPRMTSPYHYPEGPYSNLPFNTKTKFFAVRYWLYMITGFFAPFGIAGASFPLARRVPGCLGNATILETISADIFPQSGKPTSPRHKRLAWVFNEDATGLRRGCLVMIERAKGYPRTEAVHIRGQ